MCIKCMNIIINYNTHAPSETFQHEQLLIYSVLHVYVYISTTDLQCITCICVYINY